MPQLKVSHGATGSRGLQQPAPEVLTQVALPYIVDALKDSNNPRACAATLFSSLSQVASMVQAYAHDKDRLAKHDVLWSTLYNFIVTKRSDDEFIKLNKALSVCTCDITQPARRLIHDELKKSLPQQPSLSFTSKFVDTACYLLRSILEFTKEIPVIKGVGKRWPSTLSALVPLGSDQVVMSLIQWQRFTGDLVVLQLFPVIIRLCGPPMYDSVIKLDAMNIIMIGPIRRVLDKVLAALEKGPNVGARLPSRPMYNTVGKMAMGLHSCIEEVFRLPTRSNIYMLNGGETRALHLCSEILYVLPLLENNSTKGFMAVYSLTDQLSTVSAYLFRDFKMGLFGRPNIPLHPNIVEKYDKFFGHENNQPVTLEQIKALEQLVDMPYEDFVAFAMVQSHKAKPCAASDCDATFKGTSNGFQKCSNCSTVGYCCRECQVHDWKPEGEKYPHRRACKIMTKVMREWKLQAGGWHTLPPGIPEDKRDDVHRRELDNVMKKMRREEKMTEKELAFMFGWSTRTAGEINSTLPSTPTSTKELEWHPGYEEYESMIQKIARRFNGPKPAYIDRKGSSEDIKEKTRAELEQHPFWKQVMNP